MVINDKLEYNTELLMITMEECGELVEACSKAIRSEDYYDNEKLIEEVGDVQVMINMLLEKELIHPKDIMKRMKYKKEKLQKYSNLI
tara:strand:- start:1496 stop:1756 length:261 start_codon:yes stop_codon:yes gene_type:complete